MKITKNQAFSKIWIIVILVAIIGAGILAWSYSGIQNNDNENKINEETFEDETADWKTYRNEEYGFEIKYPPYWKISEDIDVGIGGTYRPDANRVTFPNSEPVNIQIEYWTKLGEGMNTLQDWIEARKDALTNPIRNFGGVVKVFEFKEENITLDNLSAKKISVTNLSKGGKFRYIQIYAQRKEQMYEISTQIPFDQQNVALPIFNQMLSTFKFTENAVEKEKPYIKILSPNGGEQWIVGETYDITWESSGIEEVSIETTGTGHHKILGIVDADDKKFAWTIPALYSFSADSTNKKPQLKIFISKFSGPGGISDVSDDYFSVIKK